MDNPNAIKYSDLIKPDSSITDLIGQLEELIPVYEKAQAKIQATAVETAKNMNGLSGATDEQRKAILANAEATEKLLDRKSTRLNSSHTCTSRMPSSA